MLKDLLKLYCIWFWDILLCFGFFVFCFCLFCIFGFFFLPLMRQWQNYFWDIICRIEGWGTNTKIIKIETLLHLNLGIFFLSSLCPFNACLAYCWSEHSLSLFISLTLFFLLLIWFFFFYLFVCLFFPFSLPSWLSLSSHPSILNITIVIITS
jgi:hypothetical protein